MDRMLRNGKTQAECARHFGVSESAVSQARKNLNTNVVKSITLENAHRVVRNRLDAAEQINEINRRTFDLIGLLQNWIEGDESAIETIRKSHSIKRVQYQDPKLLYLKCLAEVRQQLELQRKIFETLYDLQGAEFFQNSVLEAIGEASPDVRKKIIEKLSQRQAIRRSFS